jgi:hypothetical protein
MQKYSDLVSSKCALSLKFRYITCSRGGLTVANEVLNLKNSYGVQLKHFTRKHGFSTSSIQINALQKYETNTFSKMIKKSQSMYLPQE